MSKNSAIRTIEATKEWMKFIEQDRAKRGITSRSKKRSHSRRDDDDFDEYDIDDLFGAGSSNFSSKKRKK